VGSVVVTRCSGDDCDERLGAGRERVPHREEEQERGEGGADDWLLRKPEAGPKVMEIAPCVDPR
jgi:hypothetical protein